MQTDIRRCIYFSCEIPGIVGLLQIISKGIPSFSQRNDVAIMLPLNVIAAVESGIDSPYLLCTEASKQMPLSIELLVCHSPFISETLQNYGFLEIYATDR